MRIEQGTRRELASAGWLSLGLTWAGLSWAQLAPDAGTTLESLRPPVQALPQGPDLNLPGRALLKPQGGRTVRIREIVLQGNHSLSSESILSAIQASTALAQPVDIDGLRSLAERVTQHYRQLGFPFASAFVPAQDLAGGQLVIQVLEGRYGKVHAKSSDPKLAALTQRFLQPLAPGRVIESASLERASLLLSDLPGVEVVPVIRPGAQTGEGDLDVFTEPRPNPSGSVSLDNHGSRYTGSYRLQFNGAISQAFMAGDQLSLTGIAPVRGLWVGNLNYGMPLGSDGWRLQLGLTRLHYKLREDFSGFSGQADVRSLTLSQPWVRSRALNLSTSVAYQNKALKDIKGESAPGPTVKKVQTYPLSMNFDWRDGLFKGGLTYGALSAVSGRINAGSGSEGFTKWMLDMARLQQLGQGWSLYGRWFEQGTSDNLDASEKALLGGASGVRAYPSGEAAGDQARLVQFELRMSAGVWAPYLFYDHGRVKVDARPELVSSPSPDKVRAGAGVGVRYRDGPISWNAAFASRTRGGPPEGDKKTAGNPRVWLEMRYAF
jgi:hemolysin activation/secretion protein